MKIFNIFMSVMLVAIVLLLSVISTNIWDKSKSIKNMDIDNISITGDMTVKEIADSFGIRPNKFKEAFNLKSPSDINKSIDDLGITSESANEKIQKIISVANENSSKDWKKIAIKFILWFIFMGIVFNYMRRNSVTPMLRKILLLISVVLFGVILGSDPSPMGTVKDAIVLWGTEKVIFPPRMIAFVVFGLTVVIANKFICSWGCQLGVLQDLLFRLNRNKKDTVGEVLQFKLPFVITNTVRIIFFLSIIFFALKKYTDIVEPIDPFKIYNPAAIGFSGMIFLIGILVLSIFTYRPWCHLFCPFGLVGWILEKFSVYKIKVNYETCIACESCAKACPSNVMDAILKRDKTIPDCFSCGVCQNVCPTKSITFDRGKRNMPPNEKFGGK